MSSSRAQSKAPTKDAQKQNNSRLPTKSAVELSQSNKSLQHVSQLAKRTGYAQAHSKSTSRARTPVVDASYQQMPVVAGTTPAPSSLRTPSLISGSSASTFDSPRSNALRRKPSGAIDRYAAQRRFELEKLELSIPTTHSHDVGIQRDFDESIFGILPPSTSQQGLATYTHEAFQYSDSQGEVRSSTQTYAPSSTPSTRYTDSPFSHVPTPSSASSNSSGIAAVAGATRSPLSRSSGQDRTYLRLKEAPDDETRSALQPVRESSTSSSSTLRTGGVSRSPQQRKDQKPPRSNASLTKTGVRNKLTKDPHKSSSGKRTVQAPPELAHLNVAAPKVPPRPSREGISNISDMNSPSVVVQSDLPRLNTAYHKRSSSQDIPSDDGVSSVKSRFGFPSRSSSRNASPRIDSAISQSAIAARFTTASLSEGPNVHINKYSSRSQRQDSPAVASVPSPAKSPRFGLFSIKPKHDTKSKKPAEKPERVSSKGPVAGTGHEGYGRFGMRGRSASSTSNISSRSLSSDSSMSIKSPSMVARKANRASKNAVELDDFLRDRLNPVILRGSGSTWSQADYVSDAQGSSLPASSHSSSASLLPSAMERSNHHSVQTRPTLARRTTSECSDDRFQTQFSSRLARRTPSRASHDSSRSSIGNSLPLQHSESGGTNPSFASDRDSALIPTSNLVRNETRSKLQTDLDSPPIASGGRWNFLQRANVSPRAKGKEMAGLQYRAGAKKGVPAPISHYTITDAMEPIDLGEMESLVHDVETSQDESSSLPCPTSRTRTYAQRHANMLPTPGAQEPRVPAQLDIEQARFERVPRRMHVEDSLHQVGVQQLSGNIVATFEDTASLGHGNTAYDRGVLTDTARTHDPAQRSSSTPEQDHDSSKPSKLSPVGRIPAVISKRDRDRKLSNHSFSRPFARSQPRPSVKPPGSVYSQIRDMASPVEGGSQVMPSSDTWFDPHLLGFQNFVHTSAEPEMPSVDGKGTRTQPDEFITFPSRKDSQQSYISSSSGAQSRPSWVGSISAQPPQQDDVWNEYDDLTDVVVLSKTPTTGSSLGLPFQYANMLHDQRTLQYVPPPPVGLPPRTELPAPPGSDIVPNILSVPQQVSLFLQPSLSPLTPDAIAAAANGYENGHLGTSRSRGSLLAPRKDGAYWQARPSQASTQDGRTSLRLSRDYRHSRAASLPDAPALSDGARTETLADHDHEPHLADVPEDTLLQKQSSDKMRQAALMTSKWLSFGRVLFSPANNELRFASEARVLVIDGLSSDWSRYIARTYQYAEVYDMRMGSRRLSTPTTDDAGPLLNHRQIPVTSISSTFPFPKGFFTAVVLRFPTAATEHAYLNCVAECKRVLRPGGHLEIALLDMDLVNMGSHTRKAVKGLKTRMQIRDASVCLNNLSDVIVRMIGRKGFEGVQRCVVGVPAAGRMRSQDSSGSDSFIQPHWQHGPKSGSSGESDFASPSSAYQSKVHELGKETDESITRMIAKVGRWWHSSCYEKALLPTDHSIWNERGLLQANADTKENCECVIV